MKYSLFGGYTRLLSARGPEGAAEFAARMGFAGAEGGDDPAIPDVETAVVVRKSLEQRGLTMACFSSCIDLWSSADSVEYGKQQVEITAALGSPFFHHTLIPWLKLPQGAPSYDEALERVTERAAKIADYAKKLGVTCLYEDQGLYFNGVRGFGGFWERIHSRCENTGICADLGNVYFVDETPEEFLKAFMPDVRHVHIKDYLRKQDKLSIGDYWMRTRGGSWLRDTIIGNGVIDFAACMELLKQYGYNDFYSIEYFAPEPYEEGLRQGLQYLKRFE